MKRLTFLKVIAGGLFAVVSAPRQLYAHMMGRGMRGGGCMMHGGGVAIPQSLPAPKNAEWIKRLQYALDLEVQSKLQYQADVEKFHVHMPYMMILHQEENHIDQIESLFAAYSLPTKTATPKTNASKSLDDAFNTAIGLEAALFEPYEWLIQNAEDTTSSEVLNTILMQSRMHHRMFSHHRRMGGRRRHGMR